MIRRLRFFPALCLAAAILSAPSACREKRPPEVRNVLIILIDTLRADRLGVYGNKRGLSPFLDELAAKGVVFSNAFAASSWTVPSVASLFTSQYPSQHQVVTFESKLPDEAVTLAEKLGEQGYVGGGFVANFRLTKQLGYGQGFERWSTYTGNAQSIKVRGSRLRSESLAWLDGSAERGDEKRLLYLHYMEPHAPYQPDQPYRSRFFQPVDGVDEAAANDKVGRLNFAAVSHREIRLLRSLYNGEVATLDAELRLLFDELQRRGFLDQALVVITSDHGEEFKEHGRTAHGHALFDESIRVPLIILAPGLAPATVEENVSLVDLAPTILDLLQLPPEPAFEGRSLVEPMTRRRLENWLSQNGAESDVLSELPPTGSAFDVRAHSQALVRDSMKLLLALKRRNGGKETVPEIYDLATDPGERKPNLPDLAAERDRLHTALLEQTQSLIRRATVDRQTVPIDDATKEKLRALGYTF